MENETNKVEEGSSDDQDVVVEDIKNKKIEKEKQLLLNRLSSGNLETKHDKVGFVLNNSSKARNSDVELAWIFWRTFEKDLFNGKYITKENMMLMTKLNSLTRSRARIQNDYKLFQADEEVRKFRGVLSDDMKSEAIDKKPEGLPMYSVYIDETGKTQDYLTIGSFWVVEGFKFYKATLQLQEWLKEQSIDYEFHFSKVSNHKLESYKEFFLKFLQLNPTVGFKAITLNSKGISNISNAIIDLTFHLLHKGVKHEDTTGRAPLPRRLQVWIDDEEPGSDQLKIENLKERLMQQPMNELYLGDFQAVASRLNLNIQIVDLFTSSINRRIHRKDNSKNAKDQLADYILDLVDLKFDDINLQNSDSDQSTVFNLNYEKEN